jgi:DnaK suppressor protein
VDEARAAMLLAAERARVEALLADTTSDGRDDRAAAGDQGEIADPAQPLTAEEGDDAVTAQLRLRLDALGRAEVRLAQGTFGRSIRSGLPIPEARLEADPAAELTVEEAAQG